VTFDDRFLIEAGPLPPVAPWRTAREEFGL
jgi:hypothetical protein